MASISSSIKKTKGKKVPRDGVRYERLGTLSTLAESAKAKLLKIGEYQQCRPSEVNKLAQDLTDKDSLKAKWFTTPLGEEEDGGGRRGVSVQLFLADPHGEAPREFTYSGAVARENQIEPRFEQFCSYGINTEAALFVGGQYLKWVPSSLVIPKGTKIRDDSAVDGAQPMSIGDEIPIDMGETDKLDQLLELVADYNGRGVYSAISKNSKVFVLEALRRLGKTAPLLLTVFENYEQRIKDARELVIQEKFRNHRDLDNYYQNNHPIIVRNQRNVEYLFFLCVCFHVKRGHATFGVSGRREVCPEQDCCLPPLLSDLTEERIMFKEYWRKFTTNKE